MVLVYKRFYVQFRNSYQKQILTVIRVKIVQNCTTYQDLFSLVAILEQLRHPVKRKGCRVAIAPPRRVPASRGASALYIYVVLIMRSIHNISRKLKSSKCFRSASTGNLLLTNRRCMYGIKFSNNIIMVKP